MRVQCQDHAKPEPRPPDSPLPDDPPVVPHPGVDPPQKCPPQAHISCWSLPSTRQDLPPSSVTKLRSQFVKANCARQLSTMGSSPAVTAEISRSMLRCCSLPASFKISATCARAAATTLSCGGFEVSAEQTSLARGRKAAGAQTGALGQGPNRNSWLRSICLRKAAWA